MKNEMVRSVNLYNIPRKIVEFLKQRGYSFVAFTRIAILEKVEKQFGKDWEKIFDEQKTAESVDKKVFKKQEIDYQAYICSKHWREVKEAALKRTGYKCQICSSKERLHVHHNNYENMFHEGETDVIVLCQKCHSLFHGKSSKQEATE